MAFPLNWYKGELFRIETTIHKFTLEDDLFLDSIFKKEKLTFPDNARSVQGTSSADGRHDKPGGHFQHNLSANAASQARNRSRRTSVLSTE